MIWIEAYGKPLVSYNGVGVIKERNLEQEVEFKIIQLPDGQIFAEISSSKEVNDFSEFDLEGVTEYGYKIKITQILVMVVHKSYSYKQTILQTIVQGDLTLQKSDISLNNSFHKMKFFVTNFNFWNRMRETNFEWVINNISIKLNSIINSKEIINLIKASKRSQVTTIIEVELTQNQGDIEAVIKLINEFCSLLSFAQGCRVTWVYYESFVSGTLISRFHRSLIDTPPTGYQILPSEDKDFYQYIEHCLAIYQTKENSWELTSLIDLFTRATASQPYLEQKGLQMMAVVEYMRRAYIKKHSQKPFKKILENIVKDLKLSLSISVSEIEVFIENRNNLVHEYTFSRNTPPLESFGNMTSLVSKLILGILEYQGVFYDWSVYTNNWDNKKTKLIFPQPTKSTTQS